MHYIKLLFLNFGLLLNFSIYAQNTACFTINPNPYSTISGLNVFTKYIEVFGIKIFATPTVPDQDIKHCAAVMAEYLDNDEDGIANNPSIINEMVSRNASMIMFASDGSTNQSTFFNNYNGNWDFQDLYADETHPSGSSQFHGFDATLEEVLHLITHLGYSNLYPSVWGEYPGTQVSAAMDTARGGHFLSIPNSYPTAAWYHYNDNTCDYGCMITEYIYWSLTTFLGAQNYSGRCNEISIEWELCTPAQFQATDIYMHNLITDTTYRFATSIPDGNYCPSTSSIENRKAKDLEIQIIPNPSNSYIQILTNKPYHGQVSIHDITGKMIRNFKMSSNHKTINTKMYLPGIYFIKIGNQLTTTKFIIEP
ncbi:MAG: T9SS type A sorting domain-containing protein [Saprospiraceae bacterium]|nr:T9SS type A sorting domain-containing protein [Saprospiraceae bacterium]